MHPLVSAGQDLDKSLQKMGVIRHMREDLLAAQNALAEARRSHLIELEAERHKVLQLQAELRKAAQRMAQSSADAAEDAAGDSALLLPPEPSAETNTNLLGLPEHTERLHDSLRSLPGGISVHKANEAMISSLSKEVNNSHFISRPCHHFA